MSYDITTGSGELISAQDDLFHRFITSADVKETTRLGYQTHLKQFFKWLYENGITNPTPEHILDYKRHLEGTEYTAGTRAQYVRAVKHFFNWTEQKGFYPNIASGIKTAKVNPANTKKEAFTESEIKAILDSIDTDTEEGLRNYAMILLSVIGGLRIIEMQRADVGDLQRIRGQLVLYIQGKGRDEKDEYTKIIPELEDVLGRYLRTREPVKKSDPLFTGAGNRSRGQRLTEPSISRIIKTVLKNAGYDCEKYTAHSLRHTSNTILFEDGADLYTVQRHARHSDPKTTEIYLHTNKRDKDRSEERIYNRIFNPDAPDTAKECYDILQELPEELRADAYNYILSLRASQRVAI